MGNMLRRRGKVWWYRFQLAGIEYTGSTELEATERNKPKAQAIAAQFKLKAQAGQLPKPGQSVPFEAAAGHFLAWAEDSQYRDRASTLQRIRTSFASLMAFFGAAPVGRIGAAEVEDYKRHRLSVNLVRNCTVANDLGALSLFFRFAVQRGWTQANPVKGITRPSRESAIREFVLDAETERKYFRAAEGNPTLYDLGRLMINQGCRPSEILAIRAGAFDPKAGTLQIAGGKTPAARRLLPLLPESAAILARRAKGKKAEEWLFPSPRAARAGEHQTKLNNAHDRACQAAGVAFHLYSLRHTFATRFVATVRPDVFTLMKIMGWANPAMARKYVHVQQVTAAEAMKAFEAAMTRTKLRKAK